MTKADSNDQTVAEYRIDAGWVLTVDAENQVYTDHSLVIGGGRILDSLPIDEAAKNFSHLPVVDRRNHIIMPGLVNAHMHMPMNLLRGLGSDQPLMTWLQDYMWPAEAAHVGPEFVRDGTQLAIAESLLSGVTSVNDMYFFPQDSAEACQQAGIRAVIGLAIINVPTAWASSVDEYFDKGLAVYETFCDDPLVQTAMAPHAPYTVNIDALEKVKAFSAEHNLKIHMHVHETAVEVEDYVKQHGVRPIAMLHKIGLLSPSLLAVHLTQMIDEEISLLADTGVHVLHCPESNLKLASGFCPVSKLADQGVNIAIGTDGAASNNDLDLLGETRTAALVAKAVSADAASIPATAALRMATINGARALGLGEVTGSLEVGKSADITCIEPDVSMVPMYDVVAQVIYATNRERVSDVWVAGRQLLENRRLLTLDAERLIKVAAEWQGRIQAAV